MYDLGIHCGFLLTMQAGNTHILHQQFLAVQQAKIVAIKPWEPSDKTRARKFINASEQLVMPGLINGHTHLPMNLLRGLAEDQPFWQWLEHAILPIEKQFVSPEFCRIGTELALLELIRAGVTTVCDMYYFEDVIAATIDKIGLRAVLGQTIADFPCPDTQTDKENAYRIVATMADTYKQHPRITTCISPHAPYSCSDATLQKVMRYAEKYDLMINIHMAETQEEVKNSRRQYNLTPIERLYELGLMSHFPTILAHNIHIHERDIELIAKTDARAIYCPHSNMKLACGIAPIAELLKHGIKLGIGTDSAASNNTLNILSELSTGLKLQKLMNPDTTIITQDLLSMATLNGAKALGLEQQTGSLEIGKYADCIILDINAPHWLPLYNIPAALSYAANGSEIVTTICHGQILMENKIIQTIDTAKLYQEVKQLGEQIHHYLHS